MEVLIIAQAIPTYCMSIFLIPITILNEVHMMLNGGVKKEKEREASISLHGRECVGVRGIMVWVFIILEALIWLCLASKHRGY